MEKQQSFRLMEKQKSFRPRMVMESQRSFRVRAMRGQRSFQDKSKGKDGVGKRGDSSLHLASRAGNLLQVQQILSQSDRDHLKGLVSSQNCDGETPLYVAAENGHSQIACNGFDSFHIAAKQGHVGVLKMLLSFSSELAMTVGPSNVTPLYSAAAQGHSNVVNLLLESNASLAKIARNNGKTASTPRLETATDPHILEVDKKGQTAFHVAVKGQNVAMIVELLKADPSVVNVKDFKGNTPLHIAARKAHPLIVKTLTEVEGVEVNAFNRARETPVDILEKNSNEELASVLRDAGGAAARDLAVPPSPAKQLKQTVSDIKHDVQSQLQQTRKTGIRVQKIKKRLKKLHVEGLNNAINSNTIVAVLIATVAFAAIFTVPGEYVEKETSGHSLGEAFIANKSEFIIFFVADSLALFISLAVVVVQTSIIVTEQRAKKHMVSIINKLMWLACLFISVAFVSLTYVVVGRRSSWLAWLTTAMGATIMLTTIGSMCYCIIRHRVEQKNLRNLRRSSVSQSRTWSAAVESDSELHKRIYAL
ncbi:unnamed protein product [Spirodela intermedia]|uniref:PGG domain-containing protein n=1 Tax=Spirodela intermedia TaxID=51605 RepID=A0A7I8JC72_SPIIN|nr:unnamed protein product [Spirodela intermedia]CAA6667756.1 unnamed protein product [Spirodela intermedia]